jgi:hypothetical protein
MLQSPYHLHPGLLAVGIGCTKFFLDCFGDELTQGYTLLGGFGFGFAKNGIGEFERGFLHVTSVPYLREAPDGLAGDDGRDGAAVEGCMRTVTARFAAFVLAL